LGREFFGGGKNKFGGGQHAYRKMIDVKMEFVRFFGRGQILHLGEGHMLCPHGYMPAAAVT